MSATPKLKMGKQHGPPVMHIDASPREIGWFNMVSNCLPYLSVWASKAFHYYYEMSNHYIVSSGSDCTNIIKNPCYRDVNYIQVSILTLFPCYAFANTD